MNEERVLNDGVWVGLAGWRNNERGGHSVVKANGVPAVGRQIATLEELKALPEDSVIRAESKHTKDHLVAERYLGGWQVLGEWDMEHDDMIIGLYKNITVLWLPEGGAA